MKDQISFLKADVEKERQMRSASDAKVVRLQADNDMFLLKLKEENERRMQGFNDLFEKEEEMKKEIKANHVFERVEISRSSGQNLLDEAARRIVRMAAPYAAFPEAIRRDTDILEITRTWTFTNADRLRAD